MLSDKIKKLVEEVVAMTDAYPIPAVGYTGVELKKKKKDKKKKEDKED